MITTTEADKTAADVLALTRSVGTPGFGVSENETAEAERVENAEPDEAAAAVLALVRQTGVPGFTTADDKED